MGLGTVSVLKMRSSKKPGTLESRVEELERRVKVLVNLLSSEELSRYEFFERYGLHE